MKAKLKVYTNYKKLSQKQRREISKTLGKQLAQIYLDYQKSTST